MTDNEYFAALVCVTLARVCLFELLYVLFYIADDSS